MTNSHTLDQTAKRYILDHITPELATDAERIAALHSVFLAEYGWQVKQVGEQQALMDWLQGLPSAVDLPFYNVDILDLARSWGSLPPDATERQEDKILSNYWRFMAAKIGQLFRGYRVPKEAARNA